MVPLQLDSWVVDPATNSYSYVATLGSVIEFYLGLEPMAQAVVNVGSTLLLGVLVLGLTPGYGRHTVDTASGSPIISMVVGLPGLIALAAVLYSGHLLSSSNIGIIFAVPLVAVGTVLLPTWTVLGLASVGGFIARRFGTGSRSVGLLVGSVVAGLATLTLPYGFAIIVLAAVVGTGAGARAAFGGGRLDPENERVIPPAEKV